MFSSAKVGLGWVVERCSWSGGAGGREGGRGRFGDLESWEKSKGSFLRKMASILKMNEALWAKESLMGCGLDVVYI
jgi:hypothetical protein